jgi:epoxyqueuosine reductase
MTTQETTALVADLRAHARELGFDAVGIASAEPSKYRDHFRRWLDAGNAGTMDYLARRFAERVDLSVYFPGVRSAICVAVNYHVPLEPLPEEQKPWHGRIARYALGDDYHEWIKQRLHRLADWLRARAPEAQTRCGVDTAPIMERELAARAGVGWIGKNTCIISPKIGSWLFLGEVLTTLPLPADEPATDHCGTCRRCIDACPTNALSTPYQLDARRCISYLNIEHRERLTAEQAEAIGEWLYGCDACQDACPWNHRAPGADDAELAPRHPTGTIDLREVLSWSPNEPNPLLRGSAMKRVRLHVLQSNAQHVLDNHLHARAWPASTPTTPGRTVTEDNPNRSNGELTPR